MNIVLATGIYPPDIGGPATYVKNLARELTQRGAEVTVITYTSKAEGPGSKTQGSKEEWEVIRVSKVGGSLVRWRKFAKALKKHGTHADIVYCFSSVSAGVPLRMAALKKPKKLLRLGGDFAWERYTDLGGRRTLSEFLLSSLRLRSPMKRVQTWFDHIVFSTEFQKNLYEAVYKNLPAHSVIENALPDGQVMLHERHNPLRLLFLGRFVKFKNLERLIHAVAAVPHATLTMVGEGPMGKSLSALGRQLLLQGRVSVVPPVHGEQITSTFAEHDLLVLPSITEISPHVALESRSRGLPVLLSAENGLSERLREGMVVRPMRSVNDITKAILGVDQHYDDIAKIAASPFLHKRTWTEVADQTTVLFQAVTSSR